MLLDLLNYANKTDGNELHATEWNNLVKDVLKSSLPEYKTSVVEQWGVNNEWEPAFANQDGSYNAAQQYRLTGYFDHKIVIKYTGESTLGFDTKIFLNGCIINTNEGACIDYTPESKKLEVIVNPNTENYLIQSASTGEGFDKKACINSENNLIITGVGALYLQNAIGHGIKGSELELKGNNTIIAKVAHDAFHGNKIIDIYHGDYYVLDCNDAFGSSERNEDTSEDTKLRGIIRVFGGNFHVYKLGVSGYIFDAKYQRMYYDETNDAYYTDTQMSEAELTAADMEAVYTSGFHTFKFTLEASKVLEVNQNIISNNFYNVTSNQFTEDFITTFAKPGDVIESSKVVGIETDENSGVYIGGVKQTADEYGNYNSTAQSDEITVIGAVVGTIIVSHKKCKIKLKHATLIAPNTGDNAGIAIKYTLDSSNIQIESSKGTEASYIFGRIESANNVKINPKKGSVLHIYPLFNTNYGESIGIKASTVTVNDGSGALYMSKFKTAISATEVFIGNEEGGTSDKALEGDIYLFDNILDIQVRLNSAYSKKGYIFLTEDLKGNAFVENILTDYSIHVESGENTGVIIGQYEYAVIGKLYYKKNKGIALITRQAALQYFDIDANKLLNKLK